MGCEGEQGRAWERSAWLLQPGRQHKDGGGQPGRGARRHWCDLTDPEEEEEQEPTWTGWRGSVQTRSARSRTGTGHTCPRGAARKLASILPGPVWTVGGRGSQRGCWPETGSSRLGQRGSRGGAGMPLFPQAPHAGQSPGLQWRSGPHLSLSSRHLPKLFSLEGKSGFLNSGSLRRSEVEETFN